MEEPAGAEEAQLAEVGGETAHQVNRRSAEEAHLATAQRDGIRLFMDSERFEAVAVLTQALTGLRPERPPPSREEEMLGMMDSDPLNLISRP